MRWSGFLDDAFRCFGGSGKMTNTDSFIMNVTVFKPWWCSLGFFVLVSPCSYDELLPSNHARSSSLSTCCNGPKDSSGRRNTWYISALVNQKVIFDMIVSSSEYKTLQLSWLYLTLNEGLQIRALTLMVTIIAGESRAESDFFPLRLNGSFCLDFLPFFL